MPKSYCNRIGLNIKKYRQRKSWTQEKLAEEASLHVSYIGQIERGLRLPSLNALLKISEALKIDVRKLF